MSNPQQWTTGFVARVTFKDNYANYFSHDGNPIIEMFYPDDEDVFEFIEFVEEHRPYVVEATVLMPDGKVIDARAMGTFAEDN